MRHTTRWVMIAAILAAPGAARAETPDQLIKRILTDPSFIFHQKHRVPRSMATPPPDTPLVDMPMPHLRPVAPTPALAYQADPPPVLTAPAAVPLPRVSPADHGSPAAPPATTSPVGAAALRGQEVAMLSAPDLPKPLPAPHPLPGEASCSGALAEMGVVATLLPTISAGACGIPDPVKLTAVAGGAVKIEGDATVDCAIAEKLARWVSESVEPKAEAGLGGKVTALRVVDSYSCRNRDGLATTKLSEHAHGNAIDIGAFQIDRKRWITVGDGDNGVPETTFLAAVRQSACGPFTTVLGPGSDTYHASHFHLDLAERRTAGPSHGLFCQ